MWDQISPTLPHVTYLTISIFLIIVGLVSRVYEELFHLSEPPLAVLFGILVGPKGLSVLTLAHGSEYGYENLFKEFARVILAIRCFVVGIELPKFYFYRHWSSVLYLLVPVMTVSWALTSLFAFYVFKTSIPVALVIGACLSPTDPVLAASVLANAQFSPRVPNRIRCLLVAESACNDGVSIPFLFIGIYAFRFAFSPTEAIKTWVIRIALWECIFGVVFGLVIGKTANYLLRFMWSKKYISQPSFSVFYLLVSLLSVGVGSTLGCDDFLVAFGAGVGFGHDGWFSKKTKSSLLPEICDFTLNSMVFIFFGTVIPWQEFIASDMIPGIGLWQLIAFLFLVILFRRIPVILALKNFLPDTHTYREALFCGHFGPMGVCALFLAIEARSQLMSDVSEYNKNFSEQAKAIALIWPVICFVVLGSVFIHGLSTAVISIGGHYLTESEERAPLLGQETAGLDGMVQEGGGGESEPEISDSD